MDDAVFIRADELGLKALQGPGRRSLSFASRKGSLDAWKRSCRRKLAELIGYTPPGPARAEMLRTTMHEGVRIEAWVMAAGPGVRLPAYLLRGERPATATTPRPEAVMAIHGHGEAQPCVGAADDYHHQFALRMAQAGHLVLCPEHRGFGALSDMAAADEGHWLDYWGSRRGNQFTLVTDTFLYGKTLVGQTVEDLVRWENWLADTHGTRTVQAVGISYGGDLAITYPAFSRRVRGIYCSGSMGSFSAVFARCYNAPAHCVPGILQWMDRSDIAGLSAPVPIRVHYGELDTPGPGNASAAYNETVEPALSELRSIYRAHKAEDAVTLRVTPGRGHEFEMDDVLAWLSSLSP